MENGPVKHRCHFSSGLKRMANYERVHARHVRGHPCFLCLKAQTEPSTPQNIHPATRTLAPCARFLFGMMPIAKCAVLHPLSFSRQDWAPSNAVFFSVSFFPCTCVCTSTYSFVSERPSREKTEGSLNKAKAGTSLPVYIKNLGFEATGSDKAITGRQ